MLRNTHTNYIDTLNTYKKQFKDIYNEIKSDESLSFEYNQFKKGKKNNISPKFSGIIEKYNLMVKLYSHTTQELKATLPTIFTDEMTDDIEISIADAKSKDQESEMDVNYPSNLRKLHFFPIRQDYYENKLEKNNGLKEKISAQQVEILNQHDSRIEAHSDFYSLSRRGSGVPFALASCGILPMITGFCMLIDKAIAHLRVAALEYDKNNSDKLIRTNIKADINKHKGNQLIQAFFKASKNMEKLSELQPEMTMQNTSR